MYTAKKVWAVETTFLDFFYLRKSIKMFSFTHCFSMSCLVIQTIVIFMSLLLVDRLRCFMEQSSDTMKSLQNMRIVYTPAKSTHIFSENV